MLVWARRTDRLEAKVAARSVPKARRIPVPEEPLLGGTRYDYADAFEIRVEEPDLMSAEELVRLGLEESPRLVRETIWNVHKHVIRFRLAPRSSVEHVLGWSIVTNEPNVFQLEAASPLLRAHLVQRKLDSRTSVFSTYLFFEKRTLARALLKVIGPLHRMIAPYLMERAASTQVARSAARRR
jgi:hypothetical protein